MKWSIYIGKVSGIKIFIHWTFVLLIVWIAFMDYLLGKDFLQASVSVLFILSVFICIVLHELGHALMAQYFNHKTKDITLLPIGGMSRMEEIPEKPKEELLVSLAGPMINLLIAAILYPLIQWFSEVPGIFTNLFVTKETFLFNLYIVNIALVLFNLLPAFPMDGGRVFRAILSFFMDRVAATNIAVKAGQMIAVLLFLIGIFYNPLLTIISILIFIFAQAENDFVRARSILKNYSVRDILLKEYYSLSPDDTISDAMKSALENNVKHFLILENNKVIGTITKKNIIRALNNGELDTPIKVFTNKDFHILNPNTSLDKVYSEEYFIKTSILPVVDNDLLIGVIDLNTIEEFIALKNATKKQTNYIYKKMFMI